LNEYISVEIQKNTNHWIDNQVNPPRFDEKVDCPRRSTFLFEDCLLRRRTQPIKTIDIAKIDPKVKAGRRRRKPPNPISKDAFTLRY
jgi:hypothetical protein